MAAKKLSLALNLLHHIVTGNKQIVMHSKTNKPVIKGFTFILLGLMTLINTVDAQSNTGVLLFSATPNPTEDKCLVRVYMPEGDEQAELRIMDKNNNLVQTVSISGKGGIASGMINLSGQPMGTYTCQLYYHGIINQSNLIYHANNKSTTYKFDSLSFYRKMAEIELRLKNLEVNQEIRKEDHIRLDSITNLRIDGIKPSTALENNDSLRNRLRELNRDVVRLKLKLESFEQVMHELDLLKLTNKAFSNPMKKGTPYNLTRIYFTSGNYDFLPKSKAELNDLVSVLNEFPLLVIHIMGHSDNVGNYAANKELSKQRAKMVYDYLVGKGISAGRLSYEGYGPDKPLTENLSDEDRAINRRVEFVILKE